MATRLDSRFIKTNNTTGSTILEDRIQELMNEVVTKVDISSGNQPDGYVKLNSLGKISPSLLPTTNQNITWMSRNSYGCMAFLKDGELWTVASTMSDVHSSGRGTASTLAARGLRFPARVHIPSSANIVEVGGFSRGVAFALMDNGELWTWGENSNGQCGLGHTSTVPFPTLSATDVTNVYWHRSNNGFSVTDSRLFIKKTNGKIYGTGYNGYGQLGIGNTSSQSTWTEIKKTGNIPFNPGEIIQFYNLGSTYGVSIAITETNGNRKIWLCGYNGHGNLGNGTTSALNYFTDLTLQWAGVTEGPFIVHNVTGGFGYYTDTAYGNTTLMMLIEAGGTRYVKACGNNTWGQLGDGTTTQRTTPVTMTTPGNPVAVVNPYGGVFTTLILLDNKELWGCGYNGFYQLAIPGNNSNRTSLVLITSNVDDIITDCDQPVIYPHYAPVIVRKGALLYAWGYNTEGQCGVGTTAHIQTPVRINIPPIESDFHFGTANLAGREQVFYIFNGGKFYIWGQTLRGLLGADVNTLVPVEVKLPI
jgi:alpha-tubulin suppressor-like RCC1 family protein